MTSSDDLIKAMHEDAQAAADRQMDIYFHPYQCDYCGSRYTSQSAADACCMESE